VKRFQDKVVLITGATEGVGYQAAKQFALEGAKLALIDNYHNISAMQLSSDDQFISERSLLLSVESGEDSEIAVCIDDIVHHFGTIDIFVYATNTDCSVGPITSTEETDLNKVYYHLKEVCYLFKHVIPVMHANNSGAIITYSTIGAQMGLTMLSSQVMIQHAMLGLTKTAALETSDSNIRVNAVVSGPVNSDMMNRLESKLQPGMERQMRKNLCQHIPMNRYADPEEVARIILFLASDEARYTTGSVYTADGGLSAAR
jgi:3alpha(or 20beta)-hydroxysteroid dehydrogenase